MRHECHAAHSCWRGDGGVCAWSPACRVVAVDWWCAVSAEVLREAAQKIRARAEAATDTDPLPWFAHGGAVYAGTAAPHQVIAPTVTYYDDAEHIASWHPLVALAVADWLDHEAQIADEDAADGYEMGPRYPGLVVARAYLGGVR